MTPELREAIRAYQSASEELVKARTAYANGAITDINVTHTARTKAHRSEVELLRIVKQEPLN